MDAAEALTVATVMDVAIAAAYAGAGVLVARRVYVPDAERAAAMFSLWWSGIAATGAASSLDSVLYAADAKLSLIDALDQASLVTYSAALVGFTSYVAYIYLGHHKADAFIVPAYLLLVSWSVANAIVHPARSARIEGGRIMMERGASFGPPEAMMALLLVVPLVLAMVAFASLYWRSQDREARFRIALVTLALVAWLGGVTTISLGATAVEGIAARGVVLASAGAILVAYRPPGLLRRWLGDTRAIAEDLQRRALLDQRVRDLV